MAQLAVVRSEEEVAAPVEKVTRDEHEPLHTPIHPAHLGLPNGNRPHMQPMRQEEGQKETDRVLVVREHGDLPLDPRLAEGLQAERDVLVGVEGRGLGHDLRWINAAGDEPSLHRL